ncbi:MAG: flavodoxin domain-containing protein [Candidatus Alcyoniella australis]|nr:flavodoxin domain-containing protein [Candidatus Alcyoniella australis]
MAKLLIVYQSRTGNTQRIAEVLAEAAKAKGIEAEVKRGRDTEVADLEAADAVALGGATYHHDLIPSMKEFLFKVEAAKLEGKPGLAFGSFGWSADAIEIIQETLIYLFKMDVVEPLKVNAWKEEEGMAQVGRVIDALAAKL